MLFKELGKHNNSNIKSDATKFTNECLYKTFIWSKTKTDNIIKVLHQQTAIIGNVNPSTTKWQRFK